MAGIFILTVHMYVLVEKQELVKKDMGINEHRWLPNPVTFWGNLEKRSKMKINKNQIMTGLVVGYIIIFFNLFFIVLLQITKGTASIITRSSNT